MITRLVITTLVLAGGLPGATMGMDSTRGERLFTSLSCIRCHSINGQGGKVGPDLGGRIDRDFTPASLASTMWNHAPKMWEAMRAQDVHPADLDEQAAADLFAYFYAARYFEKLGDAGRGKAAFTAKHCAECHGVTEPKNPAAKPLTQWASVSQPISLVAAMWNHVAAMRAEFSRRKIAWPQLTAEELTDISVYVRGIPGSLRQPDLLLLSSSGNGQALFESKGCAGCHTGKLALAPRLRGRTLTEIAVDMWNHAPKMSPTAPTLDTQEMRDLASFLWERPFFAAEGNVAAGKRVFAGKRCAVCHQDPSSGAPQLPNQDTPLTGSAMVSVLWRHGPQMMERMKQKNIPWPHLDGPEMSNLIAYLDSGGGAK